MKGVAIPMKTKHLIQKLTCVVLVPSILLMSACSAQGQPEESTNDTTQPPCHRAARSTNVCPLYWKNPQI